MTDWKTVPTEARLKPCPFCGGAASIREYADGHGVKAWRVECQPCWTAAAHGGARETEADAVEAWNRRASPPAPAGEPVAEAIHAARGHDPREKAITAYGKPYGAWADTLKIAEAIKPYLAPLDAAAIRAEARREGIQAAVAWVQKRLDDYVSEHGVYDPSTGVTEFPGNGDEYVGELEEITDGLRTLFDKGEAEGWRSLDDCPSDGTPVWVSGGRHYKKPELLAADGDWWRSEAKLGSKSVPTVWMPLRVPAPPAGGRDAT